MSDMTMPRKSIFLTVGLPHGHKVLRADDECFVVEVVFHHSGEGRCHDGFAQSNNVADQNTAAAIQVAGSDFDSALLELEELVLKTCRQSELAQAGSRLDT